MSDLLPYQEAGIDWLIRNRRNALGDEQGLGKSVQLLRAAEAVAWADVHIICKARNIPTWKYEIEKWLPKGEFSRPRFVIQSYEGAAKTLPKLERAPQVSILDEAQMLKNPTARRTKAIYNVVNRSEYVWPASGTFMPNNPLELYIHLFCLREKLLPRVNGRRMEYAEWMLHFCEIAPGFRAGTNRIVGVKNADELRAILEQFMLRRTVAGVLPQLPPVRYADLVVETDARVLLELNAATPDILLRDDDLPDNDRELATIRKLLALAKSEPYAHFVSEELADYPEKKLLIAGWTVEALEKIRDVLKPFNPLLLYGKTPKREAETMERRFQDDPSCRVFIGNIMSAGTGLTLTAASHVDFFERSWSPGDNDQIMRRLLRHGQKAPFIVCRDVSLQGSVDTKVMAANRRKTQMINQVMAR